METNHDYRLIDELVLRAQRGDAKALAELRRMFAKLITAALRRCVRKLPEVERYQEDLEADATLVFRDLVMRYDVSLSYPSYYFGRFIDQALLTHAKRTYLKGAHDVSIEALSCEIADERQADPFGKALEDLDLRNALATLGDKQRAAIELYFFEGLTQQHAAERLGITQASLCKRLARALSSLKDALS